MIIKPINFKCMVLQITRSKQKYWSMCISCQSSSMSNVVKFLELEWNYWRLVGVMEHSCQRCYNNGNVFRCNHWNIVMLEMLWWWCNDLVLIWLGWWHFWAKTMVFKTWDSGCYHWLQSHVLVMSYNGVTKLKRKRKKRVPNKTKKQWTTINNLTHNGNKDHWRTRAPKSFRWWQ